jgi:agmatinase
MSAKPTMPSTISDGFASPDIAQSDYESSKVVLVPIPYDATTSWKTGTREGPGSIISASSALELFDEELLYSPADVGIATLEPLEPDVRGPEWMVKSIEDFCKAPVGDSKFVIGIGGEHTISLGCLAAQVAFHGSQVSVLQIDAHADLRDSYLGSKYCHACVMRRVFEKKLNMVQVGIRSFSKEEYDFMQKNGIKPIGMNEIRSSASWIDDLIERLSSKVYITLDLDGLDPSVCPGVGTPEPGGLDWYELTGLLRNVFEKRDVIGCDVVECLPLSGQYSTEFLAAKLIYKLIGYAFMNE